MIDESIMEKIIPLPDEDEEMEKVQGELEGEGFPITNFKKGGIFCGGVIAAGMETGLKALGAHTAQLPKLELQTPERVIGRNTEGCMLSGAVYGTAALLDGVVAAVERELGESVSFVITGGGAAYVDRLVTHPHSYDPDMILKGLAYLYRLNKKEK